VAFFNQEIRDILRFQISPEMVEEVFMARRQTFGKGLVEMHQRSEKTKQDIQKRIKHDTHDKVSTLSQANYEERGLQ